MRGPGSGSAAPSRSRTCSRSCRCGRTSGSPRRRASAGRCGSGGARLGARRRSRRPTGRSSGSGSRRGPTPAAGSLSHGDKRRLELAMVLAGEPRVILLDEPMAGVSVENVHELVELIRTVHVEEKKTVLMVEHHIEVVTGLADRIAVMHHGRLLACDTPAAIMAERRRAGGVRGGAPVTALLEVRDLHVRLAGLAHPPGRQLRRARGHRDRAARPQRRRQDDDAAGAARPRAPRGTGRARRRRHHARADAQDRPAGRRLRPRGPRRLRRRSPWPRTCELAVRNGSSRFGLRLRALPGAARRAPRSGPARCRAGSSRWSRSPGRC